MLRAVSLFSIATTALSARAVDAYSNLGPSPLQYSNDDGYVIDRFHTQGVRFTATAGGVLTGFQVAMNNDGGSGPLAYTLRLYSNGGASALGDLLGTYSGMSTGVDFFSSNPTSGLSSVSATGPSVTITGGGTYWLVASSANDLAWSSSLAGSGLRYSSPNRYYPSFTAAFSVQVASIPSAVPGPAAALPFALMALRRRKRA